MAETGGTHGGPMEKVADLASDIGEYIRQQRNTAQISLRQLAKLAGVSNPYLSQIERGLRKPSAEILQQIAKGLRISAEALYVQAGILEERIGGAVCGAGPADSDPTERGVLREKLDPSELRKLLDTYTTAAANLYSYLAEHGEETLDKLRSQPQVKKALDQVEAAQHRAEDLASDARELADDVLGKV